MGTIDLILGDFRLIEPLAEGGMGQVWRAEHRARHGLVVEAAVKVLPHGRLDPLRSEVLLAEIHSSARLAHPHIVAIFDAGRVDAGAAAASGGDFREGAPWYAMELVRGGTVGQGGTWSEVGRWLLQLLDALGHAHARGVVHRDLKPSNVLVDERGDVRLVDFGMAVAADAAASNPLDGGTPTWMAPEQFMAPRALHGPWTDLYAVGLLGWALACGRPPFTGRGKWRLFRAHAEQPLPPLEPVIAVPLGLEAWLQRCAAKSPSERYPRAADASRALLALGRPVGRGAPPPVPVVDSETPTVHGQSRARAPMRVWQPAPAEPVPPDWRGVQTPPRPVPAAVLGLALTRLRELPLVGREAEQDQLWGALRDAAVGPMTVTLAGDAGVGKSALARWLCCSVHALALGQQVLAVGSRAAPDDASAVLQRALSLHGVANAAEMRDVLEARLGAVLADRVGPLVTAGEGETVKTGEAVLAVAVEALGHLAGGRLPVLWVDDAQWCPDGLELARLLLARGRPCLVVLTVRRDARDDDDVAADRLAELSLGGTVIEVEPLDSEAFAALLASVGGFDPTLGEALFSRTGGNPLFALELVADWADRGVCVPGDDGWVLPYAAEIPMPQTLHNTWSARVERLLVDVPLWWGPALELAAVLGDIVDGQEWSEACALAELEVPGALVHRLVAEGLAVHDPGTRGLRWRLVHGMLRETLVARAEARGALVDHDLAVARMLEPKGRHASPRRARHLERAGQLDPCIDAWMRATFFLREVDKRRALQAAVHVKELLRDIAPADPRHVAVAFAHASLLAQLGRVSEANGVAEALVASGVARGDALSEGLGCTLLSIIRRKCWDCAGAVEAASRAVEVLQRLADPQNRLAEAWVELGFSRFSIGDVRGAHEAFVHSGHTAFIDLMKVQADLLRSVCRVDMGDVAGARVLLEAVSAKVPADSALLRTGLEQARAVLAHAEGRLEDAQRHIEVAIRTAEALFRIPTSTALALWIEVRLGRGLTAEAVAIRQTYDAPERYDALEWVTTGALIDSVIGRPAAVEAAIARMEADVSGQVSAAMARRLEWIFHRIAAQDADVSRRSGSLAAAAWDRCGRPVDADRVRAALRASEHGPDEILG